MEKGTNIHESWDCRNDIFGDMIADVKQLRPDTLPEELRILNATGTGFITVNAAEFKSHILAYVKSNRDQGCASYVWLHSLFATPAA